MVGHYVVSLFGTGAYDGVRTSIYILDSISSDERMHEMSRHSRFPRNLFLSAAVGCVPRTPTPTYNLRCFSREGETVVPAFAAFAAAHVLITSHDTSHVTTIYILEGAQQRRFVFPIQPGSHQLQCTLALHATTSYVDEGRNTERIIIRDLFGIVRRGISLEFIEAEDTLIIYDEHTTASELVRLRPTHAPYSHSTAERLRVHTVVVCVRDEHTGGVFARAFWPRRAYNEAHMPVPALAYVRNAWDQSSHVIEISWMSMGKRCFMVKHSHNTLIATATTVA
ncbi:hypothetical protein IW136_000530 [Coemansia sp. RSA 678]|nr:hypothetical protein IW136_000530 [Coemansia sp. RSA 678]